ncbi:MAG: hypothetical protein IJI22_03050 [Bacilli bacterium]|nr:hypothetical protein [Bacilli bacterium]
MTDENSIDFSNITLKNTKDNTSADLDSKLDNMIDSMLNRIENQTPEDFAKKEKCFALMDKYLALNGKNSLDDYSDVIMPEFERSDDWESKIQVLEEALKEKKPIEQTHLYPAVIGEHPEDDNHFFK